MLTDSQQRLVEKLCREFTDQGRIIEAGWVSFKIITMPTDASLIQIDEMRTSFFAGAQHLFSSIMTILDPGEEPTEGDMRRFEMIDDELQKFLKKYELQHLPTDGSA